MKSNSVECEIVVTKKDIHYIKIKEIGIKIHVLERASKRDFSIFFKFYQIANKFKPDIIHVWGNMVAIYAIPTKILLRIPLINNQITASVPLKSENKCKLGFNFFFSDKIVANTKIGIINYGANPQKSYVIYNGFDFNRIGNLESTKAIKARFDIKSDFVIGMVAGFSIYKDYFTFINAAINILKNNTNLTFICVGAGEYQSYYDMVPMEFKKSILFLGKQQNVESIMSICDIGVLTSYGEGISNALLEFMALGKPVIATNLGGNLELIESGYNGYLIGESAENELVDKIATLLENEELRKKIGYNNVKTIREKFDMDTMKDSFIEVYKSALNK